MGIGERSAHVEPIEPLVDARDISQPKFPSVGSDPLDAQPLAQMIEVDIARLSQCLLEVDTPVPTQALAEYSAVDITSD